MNDAKRSGTVDAGVENNAASDDSVRPAHFIEHKVLEDQKSGKFDGRVQTRFPPEPNGHLHIGHAKAICVSFGIAERFGGKCNLRFDDTNPIKEEQAYVEAIKEDIRWLGFDWGERERYASDYFPQLYEWAIQLIKAGKAYVCDSTQEAMRAQRGTLKTPGTHSPHRDRSVAENLDLFTRMKAGEFPDGARVLRAKIDMAHPNLLMRDPVLYRILHAHHHRTGDEWCIYPMYDYAHGQSDSIEGVTHSLCSLEFEVHRPLYNWLLDALEIYHPEQTEFARLRLSHTLLSKRKLRRLVDDGIVNGWDDPRMPTLCGFRRRGFTPAAIRDFSDRIGVARVNSIVDVALLESCAREDLNLNSPRVMAVLEPLKVVIENYPADQVEELTATNHPNRPELGERKVPFSRVIYIERADFMEEPPRKFFRLGPGREVRLRSAYYITCQEVIKGARGEILELRCTYDPATRGGSSPDGRKVKGTLHWVSAAHACNAEVRLYDNLFTRADPEEVDQEGEDFLVNVNPHSLTVLARCKVEPSLATAAPGTRVQFERQGYFCVDVKDSTPQRLVLNRTLTLRDSWAKIKKARG